MYIFLSVHCSDPDNFATINFNSIKCFISLIIEDIKYIFRTQNAEINNYIK